jgi:hypothetical protein
MYSRANVENGVIVAVGPGDLVEDTLSGVVITTISDITNTDSRSLWRPTLEGAAVSKGGQKRCLQQAGQLGFPQAAICV